MLTSRKPRKPLKRSGDMLLLADIYCMYNRARGSQLVSPDDLREACGLMERLRLGMRLIAMSESKILVVQSDDLREDKIQERIAAELKSRAYVDAQYLASEWNMSLPVAREHLLVQYNPARRVMLRCPATCPSAPCSHCVLCS